MTLQKAQRILASHGLETSTNGNTITILNASWDTNGAPYNNTVAVINGIVNIIEGCPGGLVFTSLWAYLGY